MAGQVVPPNVTVLPSLYVDGFHHALIASAMLAAAGAIATAWLLLPGRTPAADAVQTETV